MAQYLDYEKVEEYILTVQATDRGVPPLSNQVTVNVTVLDYNDNMPTFEQKSYSARVPEDIAIGDIAGVVTVSSPECLEPRSDTPLCPTDTTFRHQWKEVGCVKRRIRYDLSSHRLASLTRPERDGLHLLRQRIH